MKRISLSQLYFREAEPDLITLAGTLFTDVEFRADSLLSYDDDNITEKLMKGMKKNGISASSMHAPFSDTDISAEDEWYRVRSVREIEKACILLSRLGGKYLVVHPSMSRKDNHVRSFDSLFKSLSEVRETAARLGCEVLLENTLPGGFGSREEHTELFVKEGYYLCLDTGHALLSGIDIEKYFIKFKKNIKAFHLHENDGSKDSHKMIESEKMKDLARAIIASADPSSVFVFEVYENGLNIKALSDCIKELL